MLICAPKITKITQKSQIVGNIGALSMIWGWGGGVKKFIRIYVGYLNNFVIFAYMGMFPFL